MGSKNIIAIGAVVAVIVIAAAYLILDDGGSDEGGVEGYEMRAPEIGDHYTYLVTMTDPDGQKTQYSMTDTLKGVYDDGTQIISTTASRTVDVTKPERIWSDHGRIATTGTETIDSPIYGEVVCDVVLSLEEDTASLYIYYLAGTDDYVGQITVRDDGWSETLILYWTSTFKEHRTSAGSCGTVDKVSQGDLFAYMETVEKDDGTTECYTGLSYAASVDGDAVTAYRQTYGGSEAYQTTADVFLGVMDFEGRESIGSILYGSWSYGDRLCDIIVGSSIADGREMTCYVGVDDGVVYYMTYEGPGYTYSADLVYSTLVVGDGSYWTGTVRDAQCGDRIRYLSVSVTADGAAATTFDRILMSTMDGKLTVREMADMRIIGETDTFVYTTDGPTDDGEQSQDSTYVSTYGELPCYTETLTNEDGTTSVCWVTTIDGYDALVKEAVDGEGRITTMYLVSNTMFERPLESESPIVLESVDVGDTKVYGGTLNGLDCTVVLEVTGIEGDEVTVQRTVTAGTDSTVDTYTTTVDGFLYISGDAEPNGQGAYDMAAYGYGTMVLDNSIRETDGQSYSLYSLDGTVYVAVVYEDRERLGELFLESASNMY